MLSISKSRKVGKKLSLIFFILFIGLSFSFNGFAQEEPNKEEKKEVKNTEQKEQVSDDKPFNTICPVSTEDVDEKITYSYEGKTYALCCNKCLKKFKADPEKYIKRLSEDGKSIVKSK